MIFDAFLIAIPVFLVTVVGVEGYRRWSLRRSVLDIPNERSSHTVPTPRGGGILIFAATIAAYASYGIGSGSEIRWGFLAGAVLVGTISIIDDVRHVPVGIRFAVHSIAAGLLIVDTGGFSAAGAILPGWLAQAVSFAWVVWMINSYNFMDGIDGIAATQGVTAAVFWALLAAATGETMIFVVACSAGASSLGFLYHNWMPARIFMGDVGSAFLGFVFAAIPFMALGTAGKSWFQLLAAVPVWFFLVDSVYTFLKRLARGERVWRAHREHIYQRLVIGGARHNRVSLLYGALSAGFSMTVLAFFWDGSSSWNGLVLLGLPWTLALLASPAVLRRLRGPIGN